MIPVTSIKKLLRLKHAILITIWKDKEYEKTQTPNLYSNKRKF